MDSFFFLSFFSRCSQKKPSLVLKFIFQQWSSHIYHLPQAVAALLLLILWLPHKNHQWFAGERCLKMFTPCYDELEQKVRNAQCFLGPFHNKSQASFQWFTDFSCEQAAAGSVCLAFPVTQAGLWCGGGERTVTTSGAEIKQEPWITSVHLSSGSLMCVKPLWMESGTDRFCHRQLKPRHRNIISHVIHSWTESEEFQCEF